MSRTMMQKTSLLMSVCTLVTSYGMESPQVCRKNTTDNGALRKQLPQPSLDMSSLTLAEVSDEVNTLMKRMEEINADHETVQRENIAIQNSFAVWRDCTQKLKSTQKSNEPERLRKEFKNLSKSVEDLETIIADMPRPLLFKDLEKIIKGIEKKSKNYESEIAELRSWGEELHKQIETGQTTDLQTRLQITELLRQLEQLQTNNAYCQTEVDSLQTRLHAVEQATELVLMVTLGATLTMLCQKWQAYKQLCQSWVKRSFYPEIPCFEDFQDDSLDSSEAPEDVLWIDE